MEIMKNNRSYICLGLLYIEERMVYIGAFLVAQTVKNLPAMWETGIWPLGQEDPLEKGMATHSNILALENPMNRVA